MGSFVEGITYNVDENAIEKLDEREEVPDHYLQEIKSVEKENGESVYCIVYVVHNSKINNSLKPEKWYLDHLLAGKEFLSEDYFFKITNTDTLD